MRRSRRALLAALAAIALSILAARTVQAQLVGSDTSPGTSCAGFPTGATRMTADADQDGKEITLICDGSVWQPAEGGTPAGADTQIQFNSGGVFGASADLVWDQTNNVLTIAGRAAIDDGPNDNVYITGGSPSSPGINNVAIGVGALNSMDNTCAGAGQCDQNTAIGFRAGTDITTGYDNVFLGFRAGEKSTTGNANNFFGVYAGYQNTTGSNNNFFGRGAGLDNTTGINNNFFGTHAGESNTTGSENVFFGYDAGVGNTQGNVNNFLGNHAGYSNTEGDENNFFGTYAGHDNTTGNSNTFIGHYAGTKNTVATASLAVGGEALRYFNPVSGDAFNVAIGVQAMRGVDSSSTGTRNTVIGGRAGDSMTTGSSNILIGFDVDTPIPTTSNHLNIGNAIYGDLSTDHIGIGIAGPDAELDVAGDIEYTGMLTAVSDIRMKYNIEPLDNSLAKLTSLHGLSYNKKTPKAGGQHVVTEYGFAAQEVQEVFPELVRTASDEMGTLSVNYIGLIAPMVEALKAQQAQISALEEQNEMLLRRLEALEAGGGN